MRQNICHYLLLRKAILLPQWNFCDLHYTFDTKKKKTRVGTCSWIVYFEVCCCLELEEICCGLEPATVLTGTAILI